ncbi:MAG: ROK family protein [Cecembia sp.]
MSSKKILAGDIGGSHITLALFEERGPELYLLQTERYALDSSLAKDEILGNWLGFLMKYVDLNPDLSICLAMPAPFDYENGICWIKEQGKFKSLYGADLKTAFSKGLGLPASKIKFINDAEAFLFGEAFFGKGIGFSLLLGLTLGSGLGSAIKKGDKVVDAGLWNSPFKDGIAEDYLGTVWFIQYVKSRFGIDLKGVKDLLEHKSLQHELQDIFQLYATHLSEFIANEYLKHELEAVIIGGNISLSAERFIPQVSDKLHRKGIHMAIEISQLGEQSALYGAASVFFDKRPAKVSV